jgi:nucleoid DNA-binding protein
MRTKKEYIQAIYDIVPSRMTKKQITAVLDTQALVVSNVLATGSAVDRIVTIPGVAKLRSVVVAEKPPRNAMNPATGGRMVIPAKPASTKVKVKLFSNVTGKKVERRHSKIASPNRPTRFEREDVI